MQMPGRPSKMSALSFATERVSPETRAFMLPVATPPKATVFGTRFADFLKAGHVMNIVAVSSVFSCPCQRAGERVQLTSADMFVSASTPRIEIEFSDDHAACKPSPLGMAVIII